MNAYRASASKVIDASAELLYDIIADYHDGHPAILPTRYFSDLKVVKGGVGVGTVIEFVVTVMGQKTDFVLEVTEAQPPTLLVEKEKAQGITTSFTLEPINDGRTRVTIETQAQGKAGLQGWIEKWLSPRVLRNIYCEELDQLAQVAASRTASG